METASVAPAKYSVPEAVIERTRDIEVGSIDTELNELIKQNDIMLFSKTTCAFCFEIKRTLLSKGVSFGVFECDQAKGGLELYKPHLKKISGMGTFPQLFVDGILH